MPTKLAANKTPVSKQDLLLALWQAWYQIFEEEPKKEAVCILGGHWALETGWGKSMWDFNLGNVKAVDGDGQDYQFFGCGEELPLSVAQHAVHDSPLVKVVRTYMNGTTQMASVWIDPEHPWCRFRAFHNLLEGAVDYVKLLNKRFQKSWPAVIAGDPVQFAHLLKLQHYYTADEGEYTNTLKSTFKTMMGVNVTFVHPDLSDDMKNRVQNLVALTMVQSLDDILSAPSTMPTDEALV
jgi:hypothetical protein